MKIAILGASPSKQLAPFNKPDWLIWTCSPGTVGVPRVDTHFEMHTLAEIDRCCSSDYLEYLRAVPVYMQDAYPQFPSSIKFPLDEVVDRFGSHYLTSSIALMLALAIIKGARIIGLWGVDMLASEEYRSQRPGCFRFLDFARERRIEVLMPHDCGLRKRSPIYGYDD